MQISAAVLNQSFTAYCIVNVKHVTQKTFTYNCINTRLSAVKMNCVQEAGCKDNVSFGNQLKPDCAIQLT